MFPAILQWALPLSQKSAAAWTGIEPLDSMLFERFWGHCTCTVSALGNNYPLSPVAVLPLHIGIRSLENHLLELSRSSKENISSRRHWRLAELFWRARLGSCWSWTVCTHYSSAHPDTHLSYRPHTDSSHGDLMKNRRRWGIGKELSQLRLPSADSRDFASDFPHTSSQPHFLIGWFLPLTVCPSSLLKMRTSLLRPLLPRHTITSAAPRPFSLPQLVSSSNTNKAARYFSATVIMSQSNFTKA